MLASRIMLSSKRLFLLAVLAGACGGKTSGEVGDGGGGMQDSGGGGSSGSSSGGTDGGPILVEGGGIPDSSEPDVTLVTCTDNGGGGSGGPGSCTIMDSETCTDGNTYQVTCDCPKAECQCLGSSGGVVPFNTCPACPTPAQAFEICGYPHP